MLIRRAVQRPHHVGRLAHSARHADGESRLYLRQLWLHRPAVRILPAALAFLVRRIKNQAPARHAAVLLTECSTRFVADHVFALSTVAFLMSALGIFVIGNLVSQALGHRIWRGSPPWQKVTALARYLSYRGFHVRSLRWNSAPLGLLLLAAAGTVFFFCKSTTSLLG